MSLIIAHFEIEFVNDNYGASKNEPTHRDGLLVMNHFETRHKSTGVMQNNKQQ